MAQRAKSQLRDADRADTAISRNSSIDEVSIEAEAVVEPNEIHIGVGLGAGCNPVRCCDSAEPESPMMMRVLGIGDMDLGNDGERKPKLQCPDERHSAVDVKRAQSSSDHVSLGMEGEGFDGFDNEGADFV